VEEAVFAASSSLEFVEVPEEDGTDALAVSALT
jgi:hypothetical protein